VKGNSQGYKLIPGFIIGRTEQNRAAHTANGLDQKQRKQTGIMYECNANKGIPGRTTRRNNSGSYEYEWPTEWM